MAEVAMDAGFLKRTVGKPLSEAMTSLVVTQPADPVEFIGEALLDFVKRQEAETKRVQHAEEVAGLLAMSRQQQGAAEKERIAKDTQVQHEETRENSVETAICEAPRHMEVYTKVVALMKDRLCASGVQLGRKTIVEGQEIIEYIAVSDGREDMLGQELKGLKEGDDPEEGAGEEGVTFNLWKKTELPPPSEPVFDEDGELVPDENDPELIPPEHLLVENVARDPNIKFFGIPKLGSYLALPVTYGSWLRPGGIIDAPTSSEEDAPEGDQEGEEAEPAAEAAGDANASEEPESGMVEGEEAETPPKAPACAYSKSEGPVELVLCMDTMGQGRCFSTSDVVWAKMWAGKLKSAIQGLESRMFDEETTLLPSLRGSEAAQLVGKAAEGEEERIAEVLAALDPGTSEEDKERVTKATRYQIKVKMVEAVAELVVLMGKLNLAPSSEVLRVLELAMILVGQSRADLCDVRGALDWPGKMRLGVSTELVRGILAFKVETEASALLAADAKEALESIDAESTKSVNIAAWAILEWMGSAVIEAEDAAAAAAAAAEAAAVAAAEAEAAAAEEAAENVEGGEEEG